MTTERIKELEDQVSELEKSNTDLQRSLERREAVNASLKADIDEILDEAEATDCGSSQLNRRALTCRWHATCLTCERDELQAELEKLRKHEASKASAA